MKETDLSRYNNSWFDEGAGIIKRTIWFFINALFFINPMNPFSGLKVRLLRMFGAKVGKKVMIKPSVNIKYPWNLEIGDYTWIGEKVWIDNLDKTVIGKNCCLSQGAMLLIGNHDYKSVTFDLMVAPITLEDGVWIGANSIVIGGVTCKSHSVLSVNSVSSSNLEPYSIYRGNPAVKVKDRYIH
ncbi:WcaF family extracellular polysaccharide biosynthesis acetyltransferase [Carboxylicivirga linearis]|uniref:WcaF family extracellular polysaccharide biosynthesis acetyltransferase n=1 Tax=Carboxylicivirga linearis TaxID=1628157 RepID=A0ABS5JUE8_9BACT|nr:WcaF family extracellular polysaccharide biosynthesis acetyltransferase [Carboxylicivirga linearis]MBS2098453.1 WcaF family extracellular polysaccharide biosynthesis acetyltransferase [Carboxylicivirga linearis]